MADLNWLRSMDRDSKLRLEMMLKLREQRVMFARDHHLNDHGKPLEFDSSPAIRALYNTLSPDVTVMGSAQSMKTEWLVVDHFAAASLGLHLFYVLPKYELRNTFVQNRVDKVVGEVPLYKKLAEGSTFDSVALKQFGKGVIKYVGSNVSSDYREFPADCGAWWSNVEMADGHSKLISEISPGDRVVCLDDSGDRTVDKVVKVRRAGWNDVFCVELEGGFTHTCTLGERIKTDFGWKYLYELLPENVFNFRDDGSVYANRQECVAGGCWPTAWGKSWVGRPEKVKTVEGAWVGIKWITYAGVEEVWDIQTEKYHNFFSDGVCVHNCCYIDEYDRCDTERIKEADARMGASLYRIRRKLGNPEVFGKGSHGAFLEGDQRVRYAICERCGKHSYLDWFNVVARPITDKNGEVLSYALRDKEWNTRSRRDIWCVCPECGGPLLRFAPEGEWRAMNPDSRKESWHFTQLANNPRVSVAEMWEQFVKAQNNPTDMQIFWMNVLGLPYQNAEASLTEAILDRCAVLPPFVLKENCGHIAGDRHPGPCSAGIDVGGTVYDVKVSDISERGVRKAVFIGKLREIDDVMAVCMRYNVQIAVIDSEPEMHISEEFQEKAPFVVWRCKYPPKEGKDSRTRKDYDNMRVTVDKTIALDRSLASIRGGGMLLPSNYAAILSGQFSKEMTFSVRRSVDDNSTNGRNIWTKGEDHARHADFYDYFASTLYEPMVITSAYVV